MACGGWNRGSGGNAVLRQTMIVDERPTIEEIEKRQDIRMTLYETRPFQIKSEHLPYIAAGLVLLAFTIVSAKRRK